MVALDERERVEARPHTWWHWMNGNVSKEGISADHDGALAYFNDLIKS